MKEYRLLQAALLISFSAHTAFIFGSRIPLLFKDPDEERQIKVTYLKVEKIPKDNFEPKKDNLPRRIPPPFIDPQEIRKETSLKKPPEARFNKPELIKPDEAPVKRKITLPAVDMAKIDNPSYISYYQIVREKIRRAAFRNYIRSETGEVYATFIISNDGILKNAQLIEEKSAAGAYLKETALSSIRSASPFPSFPKELDYEELSFNVAISFQLE